MKMRFIIPVNISLSVLSGTALVLVTSFHNASARLVGSSDLREQVKAMESSASSTLAKGEECTKFDADISSNKKSIDNVDVLILGCGEALTCLEDESSSTGARCVDFDEVDESGSCIMAHLVCKSIFDTCCDAKEGYSCRKWYYGEIICMK